MKKPLAVIVVRRQLSHLRTGANVYLSVLLSELHVTGFAVRLVFAPESSFGSLPVSSIGRDFLARTEGTTWPGALRIGRYFFSLSPRVYGRFLKRLGLELTRIMGLQNPSRLGRASEPVPAPERLSTARVVEACNPDLVIAEYSALGPVLDHVDTPGVTKAVLLHDLFSLRAKAMQASGRDTDFTAFTLDEEAELCQAADVLIYASQTERAAFESYLPGRKHLWLAPHFETLPDIPPSGQPKALFMGVRHEGNLDALQCLMEEIWPLVVAQKPDSELWIVGEIGSCLKPEWHRLPGVKVLGVVADLKLLGGPDTIGLAPTRIASGISIKIADYTRLGMAVLASRIALEGYGENLDKWIEIANDAQGFADCLVKLLNTPERRHALASRAYDPISKFPDNADIRRVLEKFAGASSETEQPFPRG